MAALKQSLESKPARRKAHARAADEEPAGEEAARPGPRKRAAAKAAGPRTHATARKRA
jgi:hypothetical protein